MCHLRGEKRYDNIIRIGVFILILFAVSACSSTNQLSEEEYFEEVFKAQFVLIDHANAIDDAVDISMEMQKSPLLDFTNTEEFNELLDREGVSENIEKTKQELEEAINALDNPPEKYEYLYQLLMKMSDDVDEYRQLALNPNSDYISYLEEIRDILKILDEYSVILSSAIGEEIRLNN